MGFSGSSVTHLLQKGGFNHSPSQDSILETSMVEASRNINLHTGGREKRGGTAKVYGAAITGTPRIRGIHHFAKKNGTSFVVITTNDGKIFSGNATVLKTGLATGVRSSFVTFKDKVYVSNKSNKVQTWDGVAGATSDLGTYPADWGTGSPLQIVAHGKQNSQRLWAIGVSGFEENVYISANNTDDFGTTPLVFNIATGDQNGLVGGVDFGDRLILFSRNRAFLVNDTDASSANWGYSEAQWYGGAANHNLIIQTPNDLIAMAVDGDIYSVSTAQEYGDYKAASLTRPAFIHEWIKENVDLSVITTEFHGTYDPTLRAIKIFVKRLGVANIDTALVYFIDRPAEEAWMIHTNADAASGYDASASCWGPDTAGTLYLLTGDYAGNVWKLEQAVKSDNAVGFKSILRMPAWSFGNTRNQKQFHRGHIITKGTGTVNASVRVYVDGEYKAVEGVSFSGTGDVFGTGLFGTATYGGRSLTQGSFEARFIGTRIQFEVFNNVAGEDLYVAGVMTDFKELGVKPGWSK